jgi:diguanylate cyclase (GGDEF)-like protein
LEEALARTRPTGKGVATLCIDLDNFEIDQRHLRAPLRRPSAAARSGAHSGRDEDTAARLGGDEFAILQANVSEPAEVAALARRFLVEIGEPFDIMGYQVVIGASVGIALAPGDGDDADLVLKNADLALYRAKADGKGTFRFFEAEIDARAQARRRLEMEAASVVVSRRRPGRRIVISSPPLGRLDHAVRSFGRGVDRHQIRVVEQGTSLR